MSNATLYEQDFYAWAHRQAGLLRAGKLAEADIEHIATEIETMGKTEKRELVSRLTILLLHLLKWQFQPAFRGHSWRNSVRVQRISLESHIKDNPSLKSILPEAIAEAYRIARIEAENETGLAESGFPTPCPWSFTQMMTEDFWPESDPHPAP
ncbi:DUF29 domain-containing protein [Acidiphilium sp.]|uniref:DUF29 domain-containing protein n=1 Tax=Acidiphilium sp. TaxID=527 RepID=UPI003D088EFF